MNSGTQEVGKVGACLVNIGPFVTVRRLPNGALRRARQAATRTELPNGGIAQRGDWIVEPPLPRGDCLDLEIVPETEFDEAWQVVKGAVVC